MWHGGKIFAVIFLAVSLIVPVYGQDKDASLEFTDPFVRGLKRLDEAQTARKKAMTTTTKELKQAGREMAHIKKQGHESQTAKQMPSDMMLAGGGGQEIISEPSFANAFEVPHYRLDGILVSKAPLLPVIHVNRDELKRSKKVIYWSGKDRRWVYRMAVNDSYLTVAKTYKLHPQDLLEMNSVRNPDRLFGKKTIFISARDNGPLIHTVRKGESLNGLAKLYDMSARVLKQRNTLAKKDYLIIGQKLYIRDKSISQIQARTAIASPTKLDQNAALMARKPYIRLARYLDFTEAMRGTGEFYNEFKELLDSDIILRLEADKTGRQKYNLDIGPMFSAQHAKGYCQLFAAKGLACQTVLRIPGQERLNTFESQAIIRVSPTVFYDNQISSDLIEISKTKDIQYHLKEGQMLGVDEGIVVKITDKQILVVDRANNILALNLSYLPEVDREVLQAQKARERQSQLNAAANAAATVVTSVDAAELKSPNIVKRLIEGEKKRREGSTAQLP